MISTSKWPGARIVFGASVFTLLATAALPFSAHAQTVQWIRQFGSSGNNQARGAAADATGVYVVGTVSGALLGQTSAGASDAFVRKYDANGTELWTRQFGSARSDDAFGVAVDATGVYVAGRTDGALPGQTNAGGTDAFVRKYDRNGNELWTRQFGSGNRGGALINDSAQGIAADSTGVYVAGIVSDALPAQVYLGGTDAFVRKYDANGTELWTRQFGSPGQDHAYGVAVDSTGVYAAGDWGFTTTNTPDVLVHKYDTNGTLQWRRQFGTTRQDVAYGVAADSTGIYVVGETSGFFPELSNAGAEDAFVRKFDPTGGDLWTRQFGTAGSDRALAAAADATGIYVAGVITTNPLPDQSSLGLDTFVRKYDSEGNARGILQFGSPDDDTARGVALDGSGLYLVGETGAVLPGQIRFGVQDAFAIKFATTFPCTYAVSPLNRSFTIRGGTGTIRVSAASGCTWTGASNSAFITLIVAANENGDATLSYSVAENTSSNPRTGTMTIAGQTFTVTQDGTEGCNFTIAPLSQILSGEGGSGTVIVKTQIGCVWTATSSAAFVTITSGGSGSGNDTVEYAVTVNPTPFARTAVLTIAGQTLSLIQAGSAPAPPPPPPPPVSAPAVNEGGVVNNASYSSGPAAVAPGSIVAVFGSNLNDGSTVDSSSFGADGRLVNALGGASVTINNIPAPLFYSRSGQLGIQIPFELAGPTSATIQVTVGNLTSTSRTIVLDAFAPGIFTASRDGRGAAAVLHQDGVTAVTTQSPARPGEILVLYATGLGAVTPPLATGTRSAGNQTVTTPTVNIDGIPGEVLFSGAAPGFVGLNQVNVRVPASTRSSTSIPVVLSIAGRQSNPVTIAVSP